MEGVPCGDVCILEFLFLYFLNMQTHHSLASLVCIRHADEMEGFLLMLSTVGWWMV